MSARAVFAFHEIVAGSVVVAGVGLDSDWANTVRGVHTNHEERNAILA
jgi:hypothetical protein